MIEIKEKYIDEKGIGRAKGIVNGKEFYIAGSDGWCDDQIGNLTDEDFDEIFNELDKE